MEKSDTELPSVIATPNPDPSFNESPASVTTITSKKKKKKKKKVLKERLSPSPSEDEWRWRRGGEVMLEGYVAPVEGFGDGGSEGVDGVVGRTNSLTDELEELKGCLDLGFGFNYDEIPELCSTLPALELCYSMSQRFLDEQHQGRVVEEASREIVECSPAPSAPIANWKISSPGAPHVHAESPLAAELAALLFALEHVR